MEGLGVTAVLGFGALCAAFVALALFRAAPRLAFVTWCIALFFVPVWVGVNAGFFWGVVTIVTCGAILANWRMLKLVIVDGLVTVFAVLCVVLYALDAASLSSTVTAVLEWIVPYIWGRIVLARVSADFLTQAIAGMATAAAVLALIEFVTSTNVFVLIPGNTYLAEVWGPLQLRSDFIRVEGAFGHSIALGGALAMSAAFVLATRWSGLTKVIAVSLIGVAVVLTFSRIGVIVLVLVLVLSVLTLPQMTIKAKIAVGAGGLVAAATVVPFLSDVFLSAGDEAAGSADYRTTLLTLLPRVPLIGSAGEWDSIISSSDFAGRLVNSVDNAFLVIALRFGWIPMLLLLATCVIVGLAAFRPGDGNPAAIAVAAQLPALFGVALITQFGMLFWFFVGLAVSWNGRPQAAEEEAGLLSEQIPAYSSAVRP